MGKLIALGCAVLLGAVGWKYTAFKLDAGALRNDLSTLAAAATVDRAKVTPSYVSAFVTKAATEHGVTCDDLQVTQGQMTTANVFHEARPRPARPFDVTAKLSRKVFGVTLTDALKVTVLIPCLDCAQPQEALPAGIKPVGAWSKH